MTARIVDHTTRTRVAVEPIPVGAINWSREVRARYNAQGQLWERIGEGKPGPATGRVLDAIYRSVLGRARAAH